MGRGGLIAVGDEILEIFIKAESISIAIYFKGTTNQ